MVKDRENKRVYSEIGDFLFHHRLEPSPSNYMLVHMLITKSSPAAVSAVEKAITDGFRLTQRDADQIMADIDSGLAASSTPSVSDEAVQVAAREMEAFARLIDDTRSSEEHTSELQSLMRISYASFCLNKYTIHTTVVFNHL